MVTDAYSLLSVWLSMMLRMLIFSHFLFDLGYEIVEHVSDLHLK